MAKPRTAVKAKGAAKGAAPKLPAKAKPVLRRKPASTGTERIERLWLAVQEVREGRRESPRTQRLLSAGVPKMAQKVVEEAAEVSIEAVLARREPLVNESVDLLYNLVVLWSGAGLKPQDVWAEMDRREAVLGMAEKLPKPDDA